jgi:hypothetical protein
MRLARTKPLPRFIELRTKCYGRARPLPPPAGGVATRRGGEIPIRKEGEADRRCGMPSRTGDPGARRGGAAVAEGLRKHMKYLSLARDLPDVSRASQNNGRKKFYVPSNFIGA